MIKYKIERYHDSRIVPLEVTKETEKFVTVVETWRGNQHERRMAKESEFHRLFNNWEDAKEALIQRANQKIEYGRSQIESANKDLAEIAKLEKP